MNDENIIPHNRYPTFSQLSVTIAMLVRIHQLFEEESEVTYTSTVNSEEVCTPLHQLLAHI